MHGAAVECATGTVGRSVAYSESRSESAWRYFTGLQELLHYFPPFVAGIILPTLIVLSLIVVPFFNVNIKDETLWAKDKSRNGWFCWR